MRYILTVMINVGSFRGAETVTHCPTPVKQLLFIVNPDAILTPVQ